MLPTGRGPRQTPKFGRVVAPPKTARPMISSAGLGGSLDTGRRARGRPNRASRCFVRSPGPARVCSAARRRPPPASRPGGARGDVVGVVALGPRPGRRRVGAFRRARRVRARSTTHHHLRGVARKTRRDQGTRAPSPAPLRGDGRRATGGRADAHPHGPARDQVRHDPRVERTRRVRAPHRPVGRRLSGTCETHPRSQTPRSSSPTSQTRRPIPRAPPSIPHHRNPSEPRNPSHASDPPRVCAP